MKATFQFLHTIEVSDPKLGVLWNSVGRFVWHRGRDMGPHVCLAYKSTVQRGQKELELSGVILGETRQEVHLRKKRLRIFRVLFLAKSSSAAGSLDFGIFGIFDGPRALFGCKSVFQMIES